MNGKGTCKLEDVGEWKFPNIFQFRPFPAKNGNAQKTFWRKNMSTTNHSNNHKKHVPAFLVAFGMTSLVAVAMLTLGLNALFNKNVSAAEAAAPVVTEIVIPDSATVEDLQAVITEYQAREAAYQTELTQAADQLNQVNAQVQQYESLITELQNLGVIQMDANGQVTVTTPQTGFGHEEHEHEEHGFWGDDD